MQDLEINHINRENYCSFGMANHIAPCVLYGTSYLISNYKYISFATFISQDLVLSPMLSLNSSFKWHPVAAVWGRGSSSQGNCQLCYVPVNLAWMIPTAFTSIYHLACLCLLTLESSISEGNVGGIDLLWLSLYFL